MLQTLQSQSARAASTCCSTAPVLAATTYTHSPPPCVTLALKQTVTECAYKCTTELPYMLPNMCTNNTSTGTTPLVYERAAQRTGHLQVQAAILTTAECHEDYPNIAYTLGLQGQAAVCTI